jgi:aminopeptidase N
MLKVFVGADAFAAGMNLYFERYDGTAATIEDFLACFAEASGRDLTQFARWYHQAGTPQVDVVAHHDPAAQTFALDFTQSCKPTPGQPEKKPFVIPIELGLVGNDGQAVALVTSAECGASAEELGKSVIELSTEQRRIIFRNVPSRPVASLLRGFSAPVRLVHAASEDDLIALITHDSDPFNRWQASQSYATRLLIQSVDRVRAGKLPKYDEAFTQALQSMLDASTIDPAFAAQVLSLPGEADIARELGTDVDPDAIFAARKSLREAIGLGLAASLLGVYEALTDARPYSPDAASAGRRALRNVALDLYTAGNPAAGTPLAARQFETATTMTDKFVALGILANYPGEARETALQSFYASYAGDALVIDKWFGLQATIPEAWTLDRVKTLMNHPAFSFANPNRVRSLVGAFAIANQTRFNARDGSGYNFVAEIVLSLDPRNPQVAARILGAFRSWQTLEVGRRNLAEIALRRVAAVENLSADVRDIAERSLA